MRVNRNKTQFHHPQPVLKEDGNKFGLLPIRIVETYAKGEYSFEKTVARIKEKEQEALEQTHPRPSHLPLPTYELGGEIRMVEIAEPRPLIREYEDVASEVAA